MTTSDLLQQIRKNLETKRLEIAEVWLMVGYPTSMHIKNVGIAEGLMQASEVIRETLKTLNEEDV